MNGEISTVAEYPRHVLWNRAAGYCLANGGVHASSSFTAIWCLARHQIAGKLYHARLGEGKKDRTLVPRPISLRTCREPSRAAERAKRTAAIAKLWRA